MTLDELNYPNGTFAQWLATQLANPGPWSIKSTLKAKINCLLNIALSGLGGEAIEMRTYLRDVDDDDVWKRVVETIVFPYVNMRCVEVMHG